MIEDFVSFEQLQELLQEFGVATVLILFAVIIALFGMVALTLYLRAVLVDRQISRVKAQVNSRALEVESTTRQRMDQIAADSLERTRKLGDRLDALMQDHAAAQVQIAKMQTSIEGYVALNETLNEQLRDTNRLWSQDREMITALQLENATLKTKIFDLELRIARLEDEKKVLMAQIPVEAAKTSE